MRGFCVFVLLWMVFLLQVAVLLVVGGLRCKFGIVCLVLSFGRQALLHQSHYDVCRTGLSAKEKKITMILSVMANEESFKLNPKSILLMGNRIVV